MKVARDKRKGKSFVDSTMGQPLSKQLDGVSFLTEFIFSSKIKSDICIFGSSVRIF